MCISFIFTMFFFLLTGYSNSTSTKTKTKIRQRIRIILLTILKVWKYQNRITTRSREFITYGWIVDFVNFLGEADCCKFSFRECFTIFTLWLSFQKLSLNISACTYLNSIFCYFYWKQKQLFVDVLQESCFERLCKISRKITAKKSSFVNLQASTAITDREQLFSF